MRVSVSEAKAQLTELVRRAEAGDEVVLTRHGQPAARLVAVEKMIKCDLDSLVKRVQQRAARKATPGVSAARSQDYLYDERGLPT